MPKFRKLLTRGLAIAVIAAGAGLGALTLGDAPALAAHGGHGGGSGGHVSMGHGPGGHAGFARGGRGGRVIVRGGGGRRFWHGRWWGPGIGPCWQWTPLGWIWICG
jgi:hypothetical protein